MKLRVESDLHLEWGNYSFIELPEDKDSVAVIAGDTAAWKHGNGYDRQMFLYSELSKQFRAVIVVCGNHEFYHKGDLLSMRDVMRAAFNARGLTNVHLLEDQSVVIDDVAFIGSTLWTDFFGENPTYMNMAPRGMADYHEIKYGDRLVKPYDILEIHKKSRDYIFDEVVKQQQQGHKTVVVTHHGVTEKSVHPRYSRDPFNCNFISELTKYIVQANPNLMIHGHVHDPFDYMVDPDHCQTRVVVNPRGYVPYEDNGHDLCLQIEV